MWVPSAFAQNTIKIGMITDRVGPAKPYAEPVAAGATYAVKEINARGGILGRQVELLVEDDQGRADISATAARKLVDAGVAFILSVSLTPATQQAQTVTLESKTPHITPSNGGDTLTTQVNNPNFWQTGPLGSTQIATLLSYAANRNYKRVALITENSDLGQLTNRFFKAGLAVGVGKQVPVIQHVDPDLPVGNDPGGEGVLEDLAGSDDGKHETTLLHVILHPFPSRPRT